MDFSKYDPLKRKPQSNAVIECKKGGMIPVNGANHQDPEAGFTTADYDDHNSAPGRSEPWMSSTPVILLIEYLRKYPDQGFILYEQDGDPCVRFNPGIRAVLPMSDRAKIGMNATGLLQDAASDLRAMIKQGIEIPLLVHHTVSRQLPARTTGRPLDSVGPSQRL